MSTFWIWIGIVMCITQAGMLSGLNLTMLGVSRLQLEAQAKAGRRGAIKLLALRRDTNFLLATIVWGNVAANVLLTLLSDSVLTGVTAFLFSTFLITFGGEILPQAYFSRHALHIANLLSPILRFYQVILYPIAKPTALLLDRLLGTEGVEYYREETLREVIRQHVVASGTDIDHVEGQGALNFLSFDDLPVSQVGESIHPRSIISLPTQDGRPVFPDFKCSVEDRFVQKIQASGRRWVIVTTPHGKPIRALDAGAFLRAVLFTKGSPALRNFCHRPLIVRDPQQPLGEVVTQLAVYPEEAGDDVIDHDLILVWAEEKRIITGADILGRLLRGIVKQREACDLNL